MKIIKYDEIVNANISPVDYYEWVDYVLKRQGKFILPTKTRIPLDGTDYFNVMPCILPDEGIGGVKVVTRNEGRRAEGKLNIDAQILLYDYPSCCPLALMDGNYITTIRTAAIAVHTVMHTANSFDVIAMVGLGNIGTIIGDILFELIKDKEITVKLYRYKNHAERFIQRNKKHKNIKFVVVDDYTDLMKDCDVVISSVTYADDDFCDASIYKPGCVVVPVHMRGFMGCDLEFDHVITSDLKSIEKFKYYGRFKKLSRLNDVIFDPAKLRTNPKERLIVYNLGIALNDIYFAGKIFKKIEETIQNHIDLAPYDSYYV